MREALSERFGLPLREHYARRIIVWKDERGEFAETVRDMELEGVHILTIQKDHMFELRRQIEAEYADENILLYCPCAFEKPQDNWLLDVFLYSEEFRADYWSLLFEEMNIENSRPVREYARTVAAFFHSKERKARLRALRGRYANEGELQNGIFCVLCGLKTYGIAEVARAVLQSEGAEDGPLGAIEKFCGKDAFWNAMEAAYGYAGKRDPGLLACHVLVSAAMVNADSALFSGLPGNAAFAMPAYGLFVSWQRTDGESLLDTCLRTEERFGIPEKLAALERDALMKLGVFPAADRALLQAAIESFADGRFNTDDAEVLLRARQDKPWHGTFRAYYDAVRAMTDMRRFYLAHREGLRYESPDLTWRSYAKELCNMDRHYRAFCTAYENALGSGILRLEDALKSAVDAAERLYKNWFLDELNNGWTDHLSAIPLREALPMVHAQERFYANCVFAEDSRVFVIISDGMRYEVARELAETLNGKLSGNTQCGAMVGAVPTVTPVGMAALLPHQKMVLEDDLRILCDGRSTEAGNREAVLKAAEKSSVAADFSAFRQMNRQQRQELVRPAKVVYLYHNVIDKAGESGGKVLAACADAENEIAQMMRILVNELSAATVYITADHGFLYTRSALEEYEKTDKEVVEGEILEYKRRHAIVRGAKPDPRAVSISLAALGRDDLTAMFPRGCMRFRLQGNQSPYMHGGLSLQEMMIPLITYRNKKAGQKGYQAITKTGIVLLGENRKISNNIFTLVFYQKEPVSGKVQARQAFARFEDANGNAISDEHRIIANRSAQENNDRTFRLSFHLLGSGYDRNTDYFLVLTDEEDQTEIARIPFRIDIVFGLDFDL